jgi:hypothetical protein
MKRVPLHRERPNCYGKQLGLNRNDALKNPFAILHVKEVKIRQEKPVLLGHEKNESTMKSDYSWNGDPEERGRNFLRILPTHV